MSVIRRMIESSRRGPGGVVGPAARAFAMAAAQAGLAEAGLILAGTGLEVGRSSPEGLAPLFGGGRLVLRLSRATDGAVGLAAIDAGLLSALIEMTTTGSLRTNPPAPGATTRVPTATDAALASGFVERMLAELAARAGDGADLPAGWAVAGHQPVDRPLDLILPDGPYRSYRLGLTAGTGQLRPGEMVLAVPEPADPAQEGRGGCADAVHHAGPAWDACLSAAAARAEVRLDAVLWRGAVPLATITALCPGAEIPVPPDALRAVAMEGLDGRIAMTGRLGQTGGFRALRVTAIGPEAAAGPSAGGMAPPVPDAAAPSPRQAGRPRTDGAMPATPPPGVTVPPTPGLPP
ncbi:MAG: hypothetical protein N2422_08420 [Rhodobacteraceae bacterium]|nr:hypothetical protein [Paracoccaceae bacterium]